MATYINCIHCGSRTEIYQLEREIGQADCDNCGYSNELTDVRLEILDDRERKDMRLDFTDNDGRKYAAITEGSIEQLALMILEAIGYEFDFEEMKVLEPSPCAFCQHEAKIDYYQLPNLYRIKCTHCGMSTPSVVKKSRVVEIWNNIKINNA